MSNGIRSTGCASEVPVVTKEHDKTEGPIPTHDESGHHSIGARADIDNVSQRLVDQMKDAYSQLEDAPLRDVLLESVLKEASSVRWIAEGFSHFTRATLPVEQRRMFFASWQRTNNSAMSVQGLASRLSDLAESSVATRSPEEALHLFRASGRLHRVTDEDLGVKGQVLHSDLYYRMATGLTDGEDGWQSRRYCLPAALRFKSWLDEMRLREPLISGLYSMLVHEGYTHAELDTIAPMFDRWTTEQLRIPPLDARRVLTWITVHNGGTEKRHFAHSCAALQHFLSATNTHVDLQAAEAMFRTYLRLKGDVMRDLVEGSRT